MRISCYRFGLGCLWVVRFIIRIALCARVSTRDKDQNPETQLLRLRQLVAQHPHCQMTKTCVDHASANAVRRYTAWKALQDDAIRHRLDAVLVFKLDCAFRSVTHIHDTVAVWDALGVSLLSAQEGFDTAPPIGRLFNLLASLAEFEVDTISERARAGSFFAGGRPDSCGVPGSRRHVFSCHARKSLGCGLVPRNRQDFCTGWRICP